MYCMLYNGPVPLDFWYPPAIPNISKCILIPWAFGSTYFVILKKGPTPASQWQSGIFQTHKMIEQKCC